MTRHKRMLDELDEDIREHITTEIQDNIDRGMSAEDARFRGFAQVRQRHAGEGTDARSVDDPLA